MNFVDRKDVSFQERATLEKGSVQGRVLHSVRCVVPDSDWKKEREVRDGHGPLQVLGLSPDYAEWGSRLQKEMGRQKRPAFLLLVGHKMDMCP